MVTIKNPNGFGTVYKLSGNRRRPYIARVTAGWTEDGKQIFETIGYFATRKEANIALAEFNRTPYDINSRKLTFSQVYEQWSERKFKELSGQRVRGYKSIYQKLKDFHNKPFSELRLYHLQSFFDSRSDIKRTTLAHYKSLFLQLYKYAVKHEIVTKNYAQFIELPPQEETESIRKIFTEDEIWTLWDNAEEPNVDLILILIYTGLRISELLAIEQVNVFLDEQYMIGGLKTAAGKNRIIPLNKRILPFIKARYDGTSKYLIRKANGQKFSYDVFRKIWHETMERYGMRHTIHDTRHTTVSLLDAAGANKTAVKRIIGHKDANITEHYTHKTVEELVAEINKL